MQEDATSILFLEELSDLLVGFNCYSQKRTFHIHSVFTMRVCFSETAFQNSAEHSTDFLLENVRRNSDCYRAAPYSVMQHLHSPFSLSSPVLLSVFLKE